MSDTPERDEFLERLLLGSGVEPIANEAFSERIMSMLPARRRPTRVVLGAAVGGGALLAAWQLSGVELLHTVAHELQKGDISIAGIAVVAAMLMLGAVLAGWALADR
jgi:hypothetical protein